MAVATFPDPVYAAIKGERSAYANYRAMNAIQSDAEAKRPTDATLHDYVVPLSVGFYKDKELFCHSHGDVDFAFGLMGVERKISVDTESDQWREFKAEWNEAHADLDEAIRRRDLGRAWRAETNYEQIEAEANAACDEWWASQETFLQTQPTSHAGLFAFLDHIDAICDPDKGWIDEWGTLAFPTIVKAVRTLVLT